MVVLIHKDGFVLYHKSGRELLNRSCWWNLKTVKCICYNITRFASRGFYYICRKVSFCLIIWWCASGIIKLMSMMCWVRFIVHDVLNEISISPIQSVRNYPTLLSFFDQFCWRMISNSNHLNNTIIIIIAILYLNRFSFLFKAVNLCLSGGSLMFFKTSLFADILPSSVSGSSSLSLTLLHGKFKKCHQAYDLRYLNFSY